jgi:O-methyltransferase
MNTAVKNLADRLGLIVRRTGLVFRRRKSVDGYSYETVFPSATFAPWLNDAAFGKAYQAVSANTLVDKYRCFELWELAAQAKHLTGSLLDVGTWRGGSGCLIAARAPAKKVYLCDTFSGVVKASDKDTTYRGGEYADTSEATVQALVETMGLQNVGVRRGIFPDDFYREMEAERFCFVHIDVDVYLSAKDAMSFVWPRMPVGGIVVFDNFGFDSCDGIAKLIDIYRGDADKVIVHNLNGHAVLIKTA